MGDRNDNRWTFGAIAALMVLVAADVALGPDVQFTGSMLVAPFICGAMGGARKTLGVVLLTLVAGGVLQPFNNETGMESVVRFLVVTGGGGLAVWLAARRDRRERELAQVVRVAEVAQRAVLTAVPAQVGPLAFASRYQSASPEALIGGDFYEVVECDGDGRDGGVSGVGGIERVEGRVRAVVGDVRGKGLDAVRLAAVVLGSFREAAQSLESLEEVAMLIDRRLRRHLESEDFVTAVFAEFERDGSLTVVNCGHHPPVLVRSGGIEMLTPRSATTPLGLDPSPVAEHAVMAVGDRLLLYTDGLVEARSQSGRTIALDRLAETLRAPNLDAALGALVGTLQSLVIGPIEDDLALVLAEYRGPASGADADEASAAGVGAGASEAAGVAAEGADSAQSSGPDETRIFSITAE